MKIIDITTFRGRNIYSHFPVIKMTLDIGKYSDIPTSQIGDFNEWILQEFPGLKTNCCSLGYEGGFLERLKSGTYISHVLEHIILEMQFMVGYNVSFGKTRPAEKSRQSILVYEYINEVCGLECGKAAVYLVNSFLKHRKLNVRETLAQIQQISRESELGPSTASIFEEAKKRGFPVHRLGSESLIQIGYGKFQRRQQATLADTTSCIAVDISSDKQLTKALLKEQGIPVPEGKLVFSEISALQAAREIGVPVVMKPHDGNQGKGVHLNLRNDRDIRMAFKDAFSYSSAVIVEKFVIGKDYRVLVVGSKVCAVSERNPACVTGDGVHTIEELVNMINQDESRGDHHEKPLTKIKIDITARRLLRRNKLTPSSIPVSEQIVKLRENGNLSTGGTAIDRSDEIHPDNAELAVRAASVLGIDIAGIDIVTENISIPIKQTGGVIVEVNAAPGIRMHLFPSQGMPRNVSKDIVDFMFPNDDALKFRVVSVTGTNGKTTTTRLISHVLMNEGKSVGMTSTSGTFINGKCIHNGDDTGAISANMVLCNRAVEVAVLETARGGILRSGLGYDLADVGVITNIAEDHLGLQGINSLEELAFVKSLVVEAVNNTGYAVLNAEDPMTPTIMSKVRANMILFAKSSDAFPNTQICKKVYISNEVIVVADNGIITPVIDVKKIPITKNGAITCNVENCLAAVAALHGLEIPIQSIASGLVSFTNNQGRFEIFNVNGYAILLDYGHNFAGYKAVIDALPAYYPKRLVGIIGMPGDRQNSSIQAVASLCARHFHKLYIKEDECLRGRKKGEISSLIYNTVMKSSFRKQDIIIADCELQALELATRDAQEGDLLVVFYEHYKPILDFIHALQSKHSN